MSTRISLTYYGVDGAGRTVTEAKRDAGRRIEKIVAHLYPAIFSYRGHSVVIYRTTDGYSYSLIHPESSGAIHSSSSCGDDRHESMACAISHLLSITRREGEMDVPEWAASYLDVRSLHSEWACSDAFQRAYRAAEASGLADHNAHRWACEHRHEFMSS